MKSLVAFLCALLLAACASLPPATPQHPGDAAELDAWAINGRVSLTRGDTGWHAGLTWREHAGEYDLRVAGPLGQGGFEMSGDAAGVMLVDADGRTFTARDADALLRHATGWALPVSGMQYWVRGLAVPGVEAQVERDDAGLVSRLVQSGWEIRYDRYQVVADLTLPGRLRMAREDIGVRLVIDEWFTNMTAIEDP
ncbi:MAG TPA: lipoprotein insertase outer membrane protein LolB [Gammaproteobacteria bacterium]|nr:lipoprotein insertase outer membrane protein LolB [Gammaproteobacteria bacterium]